MAEMKELHVTNLHEVFEPKAIISDVGRKDCWRKVTYETTDFSGTALSALGESRPGDIAYDPHLTGWYKIYIQCIPLPDFRLQLKLTDDEAFTDYAPQSKSRNYVDDCLWRCADMTGQAIILSRRMNLNNNVTLSGLRFVPMSEEEVAAYKKEISRTDTKRLYASDDMHNHLCHWRLTEPGDWLSAVLPFTNSDVEWLSLEELRVLVGGKCAADPDEFGFMRENDRLIQGQIHNLDYDKVLSDCVKLGQKHGLKMSVSLRMGTWGLPFPYDQYYFDNDFYLKHPELYCVDRNGEKVIAMSYAYPEVRKYMLDAVVNMARSGCDAVTLIAHRGGPYVLFEQPVLDRYFALYGEDPRNLPLNNPRLNKLHCDIMTEFFAEVREALDEAYGKGKVRLQLRAMDTIRYTKIIGIDPEELVKRGLVDDIIVFPMAGEELFNEEGVLYEDAGTGEQRIDLAAYDAYVRGPKQSYRRTYTDKDNLFEDVTKTVPQWMELEHKYGVKLYFEIMPRRMPNAEFKRCALTMYELGAERFALWDAHGRVVCKGNWAMIGKLGHKEELPDIDPDSFQRTQHKLRMIGGMPIGRYYTTGY